MSASNPSYGAPARTSEDVGGQSTADPFSEYCLNVLGDDSACIVQFCSSDFSDESIEQGKRRLENRGYLVQFSSVGPRNRSNPRFDRKVKISKRKGARS